MYNNIRWNLIYPRETVNTDSGGNTQHRKDLCLDPVPLFGDDGDAKIKNVNLWCTDTINVTGNLIIINYPSIFYCIINSKRNKRFSYLHILDNIYTILISAS